MTTKLIADFRPEQYIKLKSDLLIIGDSIITDRHHKSGDNYEATDPQNAIGGIIPSFSLSGWLRHGMERYLIDTYDITVCHPGEASASFKRAELYERDLDDGYHEKGSCLDNGQQCLIHELFGGFEHTPAKFMRHPITFSPMRSSIDYLNGEAEGHYRRVNRNIVSRNESDHRIPLRNIELDAVANIDGTWKLTFRDLQPSYIALLANTIDFLEDNNTEFMHQLGGSRNFGGGIMVTELINPLYDTSEVTRLFDRGKKPTVAMEEKDEEWNDSVRIELNEQLDSEIDTRNGANE